MSLPRTGAITEPAYGHLVGTECPPFLVRDTHGEGITAPDLAGGPALVVFFPFAFTPVCDEELSELDQQIRCFDDVAILAVSCDPPAALRAWQEQRDFAFAMASDFWPHGAAARAFGVFDEVSGHPRRASFVLDAAGRIAWSVINPAGRARPVQEYLTALAALRGGATTDEGRP